MQHFPSAQHLASWVGICPGNHQSAGKQIRGTTRKGDRWLRQALIEAAQGAMLTKDTYLSAQGRWLTHRRGKKRAVVVVAHTTLSMAYHILHRQQPYQDLGSNYFDVRERSAIARQSVRRLELLGGTREAGHRWGGGMSQEVSPPQRNRVSIFRESRAANSLILMNRFASLVIENKLVVLLTLEAQHVVQGPS